MLKNPVEGHGVLVNMSVTSYWYGVCRSLRRNRNALPEMPSYTYSPMYLKPHFSATRIEAELRVSVVISRESRCRDSRQ